MSKKMTRLLTVILALVMVLGLAACGSNNATPADTTPADNTPAPADTTPADNTPADTTPEVNPDADKLAVEVWDYDPANYYDDSAEVYDAILGGYYENYEAALAAKSIAERFALEAIAEAKLLNSAIMLPTTTQGGNYSISRVAPKTANTTLWGN
ncbi:MAG: hypothetical protein IK136_00595, partial [Oscillospiraceae bacterium]|nr:hypothetical protein [Oscillospiraceae bacterium]